MGKFSIKVYANKEVEKKKLNKILNEYKNINQKRIYFLLLHNNLIMEWEKNKEEKKSNSSSLFLWKWILNI